jgi:phage-related protein
METFTWTPSFTAEKSVKPDVRVIKYGDNYESRVASGLQRNPKKWSLQFLNREVSEGDAIDDFLDARGALEAFEWTPPDAASAIVVVCREWRKVISNGSYRSVYAVFDQVFEVP